MIIAIRVTADGVKQGVEAAKGELKKLEAEKERLNKELQLKFKASGVEQLTAQLKQLEKEKKQLEAEVSFFVETDGMKEAKTLIGNINNEIATLKEKIKVTVDTKEIVGIKKEIASLIEARSKLEKTLVLETDESGITATKDKIVALDEQIKRINKDITVKLNSNGIQEASGKLQEVNKNLQDVKKSSQEVEVALPKVGFAAMGAFITVAAAVKKGVDSFNKAEMALKGLASQMEYVGESTSKALEIVSEKTADNLLSKTDASEAIKNLTIYGFSLEQTSRLLDRLKDSAAYNRQSQYTLSEAVKVTTEGIRNENSVLSDAAGVTKNIAKMQEEYAKSIGVTYNELTQAQKVQAIYNGIMKETEAVVGNAANASDSLSSATNELSTALGESFTILGKSLAPMLKDGVGLFADLARAMNDVGRENEALVAGTTTFVGALTLASSAKIALTSNSEKLATALKAVKASFTGIPLVVGLVVTAFAVAYTSSKKLAEELQTLNEEIEANKKLLREGATAENIDMFKGMDKTAEQLKLKLTELRQEYEELQKQANENTFSQSQFGDLKFVKQDNKLRELSEQFAELGISVRDADGKLRAYDELMKEVEQAQQKAAKQVENYTENAKKSAQATEEAIKITEEELKLLKERADRISDLNNAYTTLAKGEELSASKLVDLIDLYPEVAKHIAENVDWQKGLAKVIEEVTQKQKQALIDEKMLQAQRLKNSIENSKKELANVVEEYQAKTAIRRLYYSGDAEIDDLRKEKQLRTLTNAQAEMEKVYSQAIAQIEAIKNIPTGEANLDDDKNTKNAKEKIKTKEELIKEEYDLDRKAYENQKGLTELSVNEQIKALEQLRQKYIEHKDTVTAIDIEMYALRRKSSDDWFSAELNAIKELDKGREKTDYTALLDKLGSLKEQALATFADYPERLKEVEKQIDSIQIDAAEKRAEKKKEIALNEANDLLSIEIKASDERIKAVEREIDLKKKKQGIVLATDAQGNEKLFKYSSENEIQDMNKIVAANEQMIEWLKANEQGLTEAGKRELEKRLQDRIRYTQAIEDLSIASIKEIQEAERKATEEAKKANEKAKNDAKKIADDAAKVEAESIKSVVAAAKEANKEIIESIRERYAEQIRLAEEAANAEIKAVEGQIKAIDDLMKSEDRAEKDKDSEDRIKRLQAQLEFESDETNIYEINKQIANEKAEFEKRKRREGLEDEKARLQEQMALIKENLDKQKEELSKLRDDEIKNAEDTLKQYVSTQEAKLVVKQETATKETEIVKASLEMQQKDTKKFIEDDKKIQTQAQNEKRALFETTTQNIITDLFNKVNEFAEAGRAAGEAYARAFSSATASMAESMRVSSASAYASSASQQGSSAFADRKIEVTNVFQTPCQSPAAVSREIAYNLELMAREL